MKYWQKIFLSTLILFLVMCNICIYLVVNNVYEYNLGQEREGAVREFEYIADSLERDILALSGRDNLSIHTIKSLLESYEGRYRKHAGSLMVRYNGELLIYTRDTEQQKIEAAHKLTASEEGRCTVYKDIEGRKYIWTAGYLSPPLQKYEFIYGYELAIMSSQWKELDRGIMTINVISSCGLIVILLFLMRTLLHPLESLTEAVKQISRGNYESRLRVKGKDEIAQLSAEFNNMADEIAERIRTSHQENINKQQFINNMSHEMRTPLATIYGYAELIKNTSMDEEEAGEALEEIMRESKRLLSLREELMALSLLKEDEREKEQIRMAELLEGIRRRFRFLLQANHIALKMELQAETVYANEVLLESLLTNLIQNAVRACLPEPGEEAAESKEKAICIQSEEIGDKTVITVSDNGRGMRKEALIHIGEPFYRVDKARSRAMGGAGLGLAICRAIAENQKGQLSFRSEEGKGTAVILQLPNNSVTGE